MKRSLSGAEVPITKKIMKRIILLLQFSLLFSIFSLNCNQKNKKPSHKDNKPIVPQKVYTSENLGNWEGLEGEHLPVVKIFRNRKKNIVIEVPLKNPSQKHYIEKIIIAEVESLKPKKKKKNSSVEVDDKETNNTSVHKKDINYKIKKILARKYFSRHAKYFEATFSLHPIPTGKNAMILVKCNLHDMWMMPLH